MRKRAARSACARSHHSCAPRDAPLTLVTVRNDRVHGGRRANKEQETERKRERRDEGTVLLPAGSANRGSVGQSARRGRASTLDAAATTPTRQKRCVVLAVARLARLARARATLVHGTHLPTWSCSKPWCRRFHPLGASEPNSSRFSSFCATALGPAVGRLKRMVSVPGRAMVGKKGKGWGEKVKDGRMEKRSRRQVSERT